MGITERKERQRAEVRQQILAAAREILGQEGFAALTMRKIAEAIEYSPAAIYLHFRSRDEIARELCLEGYAELLEAFRPARAIADPVVRLAAIARAYVRFGFAHPETYRLIFMEDPRYTRSVFEQEAGAEPNPGTQAFEALTGTVEDLKASGYLDASVNTLLLAELWWASVHGIVSLGLSCPVFPVDAVDEMLEMMASMTPGGLAGLAPKRAQEAG